MTIDHNNKSSILLASYGGGHSKIIATLAAKLIERGDHPSILGLTTAYKTFEKEGLPANSVESIADISLPKYDLARRSVEPYLPKTIHPDITKSQTLAYFTIGMHDMINEYGIKESIDKLHLKGRKAFEPIETMKDYLRNLNPSCIVTTTSPRFELALIRAGRELGIPTIAVSDLFLQHERSWVLSGNYAHYLCVLNEQIKKELLSEGIEGTSVCVTGNPAFDVLKTHKLQSEKRERIRAQMGIAGKVVILWPSAALTKSDGMNSEFLQPDEVIAALEKICEYNTHFTYIYRSHPNSSIEPKIPIMNGYLDPGLEPEDALLISDIVCFEISTMGLQAHLFGLPVVCVGTDDRVVFSNYFDCERVNSLDEKIVKFRQFNFQMLKSEFLSHQEIELATPLILKLIDDVINAEA